MDYKRIYLIILDGAGCGAAPDADKYGDTGSNTLRHVAQYSPDFSLPNLEKLGLADILGLASHEQLTGIYGKMAERSAGKDTPSGHWEISGIISQNSQPVFSQGFPRELMDTFLKVTGSKGYLGNKTASGTEIIKELGEEHLRTGYPIVYTSADSVFQIAMHESIIPIEKQYELCRKTREILTGKYNLGRVIARPFSGDPGNFFRTERRKDFAITPPDNILTDTVQRSGQSVIGVGKIEDIFNHKGLTDSFHTGNNTDGIAKIKELMAMKKFQGLVFANLVDFDMVYGHRRDVKGYYQALQQFDQALGEYLNLLQEKEALFITADHGTDPTFKGTDHTREYVPLLGYSVHFKKGYSLGIRETFADLGQTIAEMLGTGPVPSGQSFLTEIQK